MVTPELQRLFAQNRLRRGRVPARQPAVASGHPRLDLCLPGGGYPLGALTELLHDRPGTGEVSLLLPLMGRLTRDGEHIGFVAPPWPPYAPALAGAGVDLRRVMVAHAAGPGDGLWAAEQMARCGLFGAVLCWSPAGGSQLRRLQLAAEEGGRCLFLYRPTRIADSASPAALRLRLEPDHPGVWASVLKCRGPAGARVLCERPTAEGAMSPLPLPMHSANDLDDSHVALPVPTTSGD